MFLKIILITFSILLCGYIMILNQFSIIYKS